MLATLLLAVTSPGAFADSRYVIKGGEVYDKLTDLTWKRCSVSLRWVEGTGCVGVQKEFTWDEHQKQAVQGWRVPSLEELSTLSVGGEIIVMPFPHPLKFGT